MLPYHSCGVPAKYGSFISLFSASPTRHTRRTSMQARGCTTRPPPTHLPMKTHRASPFPLFFCGGPRFGLAAAGARAGGRLFRRALLLRPLRRVCRRLRRRRALYDFVPAALPRFISSTSATTMDDVRPAAASSASSPRSPRSPRSPPPTRSPSRCLPRTRAMPLHTPHSTYTAHCETAP